MGKLIRRVIAALLCVTAVILMLIPSSDAYATTQKGDFELDGSTLVSYVGNETSVTLPNTITAVGNDAFSKNNNITKVILPDSIKSIGYDAFEGCKNLTKVEIGDGVKSIGASAFSGCTNLQEINIPEKCNDIGSGIFAGCTSLANVNVDSSNRSYICIDGVLYTRNGKELIQYLPGRTSSTFLMPNSVEKIGEYAFWGADSLTNVSVNGGIKEIPEYAFSNCNSLNKVSLPQSVESLMAYSFADCPNLKSVYIPDSVGYIDEKAFYLTNGATIQFVDSTGATTNEVPVAAIEGETATENGQSSDNAISDESNVNNGNAVISDNSGESDDYYTPSYSGSNNWVTLIKSRDFSDNKAANELGSGMIVGGTAMFIMPTDLPVRGYNIEDAEAEDELANSGGNTSSKNDEFNVIEGTLAKYNGSNNLVNVPTVVTRIGVRAFYKDENIDAVNLSAGIESIGDFSFARTGLTSITIPSGATDIGYAAFYQCSSLGDISIPQSVSNIELGAFDGTKWLENWRNNPEEDDFLVVGDGILIDYKGDGGNISLPSDVKQIGPGCFEGNNNITGVTVHLGINKICEDAFNGCNNLKSVTLPDGLEIIEDRAFCDTGLEVVTIPDSVIQIGLGAFDTTGNMSPLKTVIFAGNDVPNVIFKDTATRLSASSLRTDAFNGVENAIIQADCNVNSGTLFNPVFWGFHGQIYTISSTPSDSAGTLSLVKTTKRPDSNGIVSIDSKVPIGKEEYYMDGVKESAFDDYLNYDSWCDNKPVSVQVSGNNSDELNSLLSRVNKSIDSNNSMKNGIKVVLEGDVFSGKVDGSAIIPEFDEAATLVISENENNRNPILSGLYNYYGPNVSVAIVPLEVTLFDKTGYVQIHKLGNSKLEVSLPLPDTFINSELVKVASLDNNGALTELPTNISERDGTRFIDFVANHCSKYAIYTKNDSTVQVFDNVINNVDVTDSTDEGNTNSDGIDNPREGRKQIDENGVVEITTVINAEAEGGVDNTSGVMNTLSKTVGGMSVKWLIIVILLALAGILAIYKPKRNS